MIPLLAASSETSQIILASLAAIVVLGVTAQWLAWRLRVPAILMLLLVGFLAGPVARWASTYFQRTIALNPDDLLGPLLLPIVSLSVGLILFEGGLTLRIAEVAGVASVVRNLCSVGAVITWSVGAVGARYLIGLDWSLAILLGAILVVTGPTVIGPLLRDVRPIGSVGSILRWEGIVIDPIGALLAVLVFEAILAGNVRAATPLVLWAIAETVLLATAIAAAASAMIVLVVRKYWVPDYLQNPVVLMTVIAAFTISNLLEAESGLFTVTLMGVALANQRWVHVRHIIEFKEALSVLLISSLFVLLAARLEWAHLAHIRAGTVAFLLLLVLVARPLAVLASTIRSNLSWRERTFLAAMAPRGIVAAAVSSVFALRLEEQNVPDAALLVPLTFLVIIGTVGIYGVSASWVAQRLGLARPGAAGFLIAGANRLARAVAAALKSEKYEVLLVDTNRDNIQAARLEGLPTLFANILSPEVMDKISLTSIARLLALTPNDEVNSLAAVHYAKLFGRKEAFQLLGEAERSAERKKVSDELRGRVLFGPEASYERLTDCLEAGGQVKKTKLSKEFDYAAYKKKYEQETAVPLFLITENRELQMFTRGTTPAPKPGQTLFSLVCPKPVAVPPDLTQPEPARAG